MSEAKHTPGPWRVGLYGEVLTGDGETLLLSGVALTTGNHPQQREAEANARLIAAAPDLLAALKALYGTEPGNSIERGQAIARAECAIAKAEGRAE